MGIFGKVSIGGPTIVIGRPFEAISDEEKAQITNILKETNLLAEDGSLEFEDESGIANLETAIADPQSFIDNLTKKFDFCKTGCDIAASAAAAACTASTTGVGLAACLAAAEVARNACRDAC